MILDVLIHIWGFRTVKKPHKEHYILCFLLTSKTTYIIILLSHYGSCEYAITIGAYKARAIILNGEALAFFIISERKNIMDHKYYFQELDRVGRAAVTELRQLDAKHQSMHKDYLEQRMKDELSEFAYQKLVKGLEDSRQRAVDKHKSVISEIKEKYFKAEEDNMLPSGGRMNPEDIEVLKNFKLSTAEFNALAEKYNSNPTMGRLLEDYRVNQGIETDWRFQGIDKRKDIFASACSCVESIIGQLDKHCPDREGNITRRVFGSYHKLQGSDPDALPVPPEESPEGYNFGGSTLF